MAAKKVVLVLHGYSQNANIFGKRLGALRKGCVKEDVELVFIDAPHILKPADMFLPAPGSDSGELAANLEVLQHEAALAAQDPALTPRAWWKANVDKNKAVGLEESLAMVRDVLKERTFDGVFGFSQGAAFATIISSLLERPHLYPPFLVDGKPPHPPMKFCVAVSGFKLLDPFAAPFYTPSYLTPTLHILGKTDVVVVEERSRTLVEVSANKRVIEHEGGHFVPLKGTWRKFFTDYMKDHLAPNPAPGSAPSEPVSGTATPTGASDAPPVTMMKL